MAAATEWDPARELRLAHAELVDAIGNRGMADAFIGLLHTQARLFHVLEAAGVISDGFGIELVAADIETGLALPDMPVAQTVLRVLHALLILTTPAPEPSADRGDA